MKGSETLNQRKTDNAMAKNIKTKGQAIIYTTLLRNDGATLTPQKIQGKDRCSRRVSSSCSTSDTRSTDWKAK
jgi:hypothetical protein